MPERVLEPIEVSLPPFGIAVLESWHDSGFRETALCHDFHKFILAIEGRGQLRTANRTSEMSRDTLFHIPAGITHRIADDSQAPLSLYVACYQPDALSETLVRLLSDKIQCWRLADYGLPLVNALRSYFREMLFEQGDRRPGWETILRARLDDLLVRTVRLPRHPQHAEPVLFEPGSESAERVAVYASRLKSEFYLNNTLDEAAQATCLSRRRFTELFRQVTGESWREYVQRLRLEHARKLLLETDKSIAAILFESGFDDVSHFYRVFKRTYDVSPQALRRTKNDV
jgi:AraC-like DNA-binding protein/mannose-6-phosphate isomerase-like protein (cupin superfamily)